MRYKASKWHIIFSVKFENDIPVDGRAIKTNSEMKIVDVIQENIFDKEGFGKFLQWIQDPEYKVIALRKKSFSSVVQHMEKHVSIKHKDDLMVLKSSYWGLYSEILYSLRCTQKLSIAQILKLYGIHPLIHQDDLLEECLNLSLLANVYMHDKKKTLEIRKEGFKEILRRQLSKQSAEALIWQAIKKGWLIVFKTDLRGKVVLEAIHLTSRKKRRIEGTSIQDAIVNFQANSFFNMPP